jgi:hypothetical protein
LTTAQDQNSEKDERGDLYRFRASKIRRET